MRIIYTQFTRTYTVVGADSEELPPPAEDPRHSGQSPSRPTPYRASLCAGSSPPNHAIPGLALPGVGLLVLKAPSSCRAQPACWFVAAAELPLERRRRVPCLASVHRVEAYKQANRQS